MSEEKEGLKGITDILPMFPTEGPPLPRATGMRWDSLLSSPSPEEGSPEFPPKIVPEEAENVFDITYDAMRSVHGLMSLTRGLRGLPGFKSRE